MAALGKPDSTRKFHAFLTHDWGVDGQNHEKVKLVNSLLKGMGFNTWFDEEELQGDVQEKMQEGIDQSACVVVFITNRYIKKVASSNLSDNCKLEFTYAARNKHKRPLISVVLDPNARNTDDWVGPVAFHLQGVLYIDMSTAAIDGSRDGPVAKLAKRVEDVINSAPTLEPVRRPQGPPHPQPHPRPGEQQSSPVEEETPKPAHQLLSTPPPPPRPAAAPGPPTPLDETLDPVADTASPASSDVKGDQTRVAGKLDRLATKVSNLVDVVLANPEMQLEAGEQLELLAGCVSLGSHEAEKAAGRSVAITIGNTGSGKSTLVNRCFGCKLERFELESGIKAFRVSPESPKPEIMPIGHSNQSMTFVPGVATDQELGLTFMDCPGFLDNRGAVINIANAVNIKQAIHAAKDVVVVVLLNYASLTADRGRGLRELVQILQDLFGEGDARFEKHSRSVMLGVSKVPLKDGYGDDIALRHVQALLSDTSCLSRTNGGEQVVAILRENMFIYDPLELGSVAHGWSTRADILLKLRALEPIQDPSAIFRTVLNLEDERALRSIVEALSGRIVEELRRSHYDDVASTLLQLSQIELVENTLVTRLLNQAKERVFLELQDVREEAIQNLLMGDFEGAAEALAKLDAAREALTGFKQFQESITKMANNLRSYIHKRQEEMKLLKNLEAEAQSSRDAHVKLQNKFDILQGIQDEAKMEMQRLREEQQLQEQHSKQQEQQLREGFALEQQKLQARMEAANEEERTKLQQELDKLAKEQARETRELEERAAHQARMMQTTLEETEKRAAEREREMKVVQAQKAAAEQEAERMRQQTASEEANAKNEQALERAWSKLQKSVGRKGKGILAKIDTSSRTIEEIDLSSCDIGPKSAQAVADWLKLFTGSMGTLNLMYNKIGPEGAKAIAGALAVFSGSLDKLKLSRHRAGNSIGPEGAKAIAEALKVFKGSLNELDLSWNDIGPEGAKAIAGALAVFTGSLRTLWLNSNKIGDKGAIAIAEALRVFKGSLGILDLLCNDIGDEGAKAIAEALKVFNGSLNKLWLGSNNINDAGKEAIREAVESRGLSTEVLFSMF